MAKQWYFTLNIFVLVYHCTYCEGNDVSVVTVRGEVFRYVAIAIAICRNELCGKAAVF